MTGNELRALRHKLGLTVKVAAASINKSSRTWFRWEAYVNEEVNRDAIEIFVAANKRKLNRLEKQAT